VTFSDYDLWKLATPPEYEWPEDRCEDCGCRFDDSGRCDNPECITGPGVEPHPDDLADFIDESQAARTAP
jgi:hypothetical protein